MAHPKGKSGNPNGRPKGVPNKSTMEFKAALNNLLQSSAPNLLKWLEEIEDPYKRFEILSKFTEFVYPKLARSEVRSENKTSVTLMGDIEVDGQALDIRIGGTSNYVKH